MHCKCICIILYLLPQVTLHNETKQVHPDQIELRSHSIVNKIVFFFAQNNLPTVSRKEGRRIADRQQTLLTPFQYHVTEDQSERQSLAT